MNIVVVTYRERLSIKSKEEIKNDLTTFWSEANYEIKENMGKMLRKQFEDFIVSGNETIEIIDSSDKSKRPYLIEELKKKDIDLLVTYDYSGFEICTLTDNIAYNLLDCRQLHIIDDSMTENSSLGDRVMSVNMFFYQKH